MGKTNLILKSIADDISEDLGKRVFRYIIPTSQLLSMDDSINERISISFDGSRRGVEVDKRRAMQNEVLRVQVYLGIIESRIDKRVGEEKINDISDSVLDWFKDSVNTFSGLHEDLHKIQLLGKRNIVRSTMFYEQFIEFEVLRSI